MLVAGFITFACRVCSSCVTGTRVKITIQFISDSILIVFTNYVLVYR